MDPQLRFPPQSMATPPIVQSTFRDPTLSMRTRIGHHQRRRRMITEREKFLLLIKMILLYLERSCNIDLLYKTKHVIQRCVQNNRQGDGRFVPLKNVIETELEALLGVEFFSHMQRCLEGKCEITPFGYSYINQRNSNPDMFA
ncbi:hypothetical protein FisN_2Lh084 [Fistulifera solaris]|uniref:Uncharacterized protein n=1 Tax=Fistulifera solaris TaxID=1519565 RepID=A0A1Z5JXG8_FISSO|nr:hypothetical protein FisN_2Lh084 [Fistulifera solaris]|eukprot:GAX18441.1 hypothetical protein FisN_2Lh084 [Fistulifera solaris]